MVAVRILRFHVDDKVHIGRLGGRLDLSDRKGGFFLIRAVRRVHAREYCYAPNLSYYAPRLCAAAFL